MILTDTGPLVALIDPDDPCHAQCATVARTLAADTMLTTWQCMTEAMHLLGREGGHRYQQALWDLRSCGLLNVHTTTDAEGDRIAELMQQYRDTPMDLADASLVAVAETHSLGEIFSLDTDFYIYQLANGSYLTVIG